MKRHMWSIIFVDYKTQHSRNNCSLEVDADLMQSYQYPSEFFCRYRQESKIYMERQVNNNS